MVYPQFWTNTEREHHQTSTPKVASTASPLTSSKLFCGRRPLILGIWQSNQIDYECYVSNVNNNTLGVDFLYFFRFFAKIFRGNVPFSQLNSLGHSQWSLYGRFRNWATYVSRNCGNSPALLGQLRIASHVGEQHLEIAGPPVPCIHHRLNSDKLDLGIWHDDA